MDPLLTGILIVLMTALLCSIIILIVLQLRRPSQDAQTAVLAEKIAKLEPVTQAVTNIQVGLAELKSYTKARQDLEMQTVQSIRRLESIIAGTQSKGSAGENILDTIFSKLPADWQVRDFRVGNKTVEFGLRLPNGMILPIDSKWAATNLIEQFALCEDPEEQRRLKMAIESAVLEKAREVRKYIDPNITVNFGVAVVPDAVYDLCSSVQCEAFQLNVVLVSYSMFVPYLLLVFQTMLKSSQSIDLRKLDDCIDNVRDGIGILQEELEGRFARAITMLANSRSDMAVQLSKMSGCLTGITLNSDNIEDRTVYEDGNISLQPASTTLEQT